MGLSVRNWTDEGVTGVVVVADPMLHFHPGLIKT
ncbi:hypothetical protein SV7mr_36940 [Stieleria bergensis]|uniref:Uncharacterized protein n=1 Tax=Stieleria bergensis TaxID=2528025 RepID=A0A517SYJ3_9BACT|nr:hypothetical protein SV7mr_36940 [Planctomycetes bacterium SV_7m_r]